MTSLGMVMRCMDQDNHAAKMLFEQSLELHKKYKNQRGLARTLFKFRLGRSGTGIKLKQRFHFMSRVSKFINSRGNSWGMGKVSQLLGTIILTARRI